MSERCHGTGPSLGANRKLGRYRPLEPVREWVRRGSAVLVPVRRGYGASGGEHLADAYGSCANPDSHRAGEGAALDLLATVEWARAQRDLDPNRWLLIGQSAGGFASIYIASKRPAGLVAVLAFSPGRGGEQPGKHPGEPCGADRMAKLFASSKASGLPVAVVNWWSCRRFRRHSVTGSFRRRRGPPLWTAAVARFFKSHPIALPF